MFTPGNNDWTDCDRPSIGGYSSLQRLDHDRQVFFSTPFPAGKKNFGWPIGTSGAAQRVSRHRS